ncbi:MAG: chromosome segregation protein SMC, partial [Hyphomicrobiaceae bacterium]
SQAEAKQRLHADRTALQSMEPIDGLRTQQDELRTTVAQQRTQLAEDRAILASLEHKKKLRDDRCAAITVETELWRGRAANAGEHVGKLEDRKSALAREIIELEALPAQLEERRAAIVDAIADAERARRQASDQLANAENEIREREKVLRELQSALSDAREQRARAEAHLEAARARQTDHARQIRETLSCTPDGCLESVGLSGEDELPDREQLDRKIDRLRADRERLGGVNLRAEHELSEITERHDSLENERADLDEAIARLRQGIAKLNKEGRRRLLDAFEEVNDHFQKLFTTLFGGGTAELQLIESDDPLESGLELVARPPGKKPTVLSLLSGGEQALTALSLIFAVFLTNPSPICVLDEVDAPLDDANVDRFCTLMEEMAKSTDTRFLVITHHPMTMSRMDRLFGVTMAERGVSQLVSVDLETAESYREAG